MDDTKVLGIRGEGKSLCLTCAKRIYGNSLEMYVSSGEVQILTESDRSEYASRGLLCDECLNWIFSPETSEEQWWLADPDPEEYRRLLEPFAVFLETLHIDALNLKDTTNG